MPTEFLASLIKIVILNLVLSGDNAVMLGMATASLDSSTRKKALWIGSVGIVILLVAFSVAAVYLLKVPYVQFIGGIMLTAIAYRLLVETEGETRQVKQHDRLLHAVTTIIVADLIMSLDNVLAVAAVSKGNIVMLAIGTAISVIFILFASHWIAYIMERYDWLLFVGAAILAYTAGDMMTADPLLSRNLDRVTLFALPLAITGIILLAGYAKRKRHKRTVRA